MLDRISGARGITLVELTVVLAFIAITAGVAVPVFNELLLDSRRTAVVTTAWRAVNLARQLAATRRETIRLCGSSDARRCSEGSDWSSGLFVTDDPGLLQHSLPLPSIARASSIRANRGSIAFEGGSGFATPATLTICDRRGARAARAIIISRSGRPRISERDAGNGPLTC